MKPGVTQLCLSKENLEADLRQAGECGYEAVELVFGDTGAPSIDAPDSELEDIRATCDAVGIEVPSILAKRTDFGSLLSPDPAEREKRLAIVRRGLEIAERLGVDGMLIHPGQLQPESRYEDTWNNCRDAFKSVAAEAEARNCCLCLEHVWNKFILSPREARQFVDEVGSSHVGIYLDTGNMIAYGFAEMWVRELGPRVRKVHVKDFRRRGSQWVQLMDGDVNWPEVMKALREVGFDGALVSEVGGDAARQKETAQRIRQIMAL